jgi:hypothetical protein
VRVFLRATKIAEGHARESGVNPRPREPSPPQRLVGSPQAVSKLHGAHARGSYGSEAIASVTLTKAWKTRACFSSSRDTDDWVSDHLSRRALGTVAGALAGAQVPRAAILYQGVCTCPLLLNERTISANNDHKRVTFQCANMPRQFALCISDRILCWSVRRSRRS